MSQPFVIGLHSKVILKNVAGEGDAGSSGSEGEGSSSIALEIESLLGPGSVHALPRIEC